jgi:hypothetical protein
MLERAQMYKDILIGHTLPVKKQPKITMPIFGNGDIDSPEKH